MTTTTQQAIDTVRDNNLADYHRILDFAEQWVTNQFKAFSSENLKNCYYFCGNDKPIEPCVYGAVLRTLSKRGLIFKHSFELSKNPTCHSRPQQTWISKEYSDQQKSNATKKEATLDMFQQIAS